ncbi:MAG: hypothetical protein KIT36_14470 [Alphaproteobacteria bacterium]|nr:hypothetical protein [Alphaproteobacteria bacterium]
MNRLKPPPGRCAGIVVCLLSLAAGARAEPVPVPSVDFEAPYIFRQTPDDDMPGRVHIRHSGGWYRQDVEFPNPQQHMSAFLREGYAGAIVIAEFGNAKLAVRVASIAGDPISDLWGQQGTRLDPSEMIGEPCSYWRIEPPAAAGATTRRLLACITADGIPLHIAVEGSPKKPLARALSLQRKRQDPAWFSMPPGVRLRDVPDIAALQQEIATWTASVAKPRRK